MDESVDLDSLTTDTDCNDADFRFAMQQLELSSQLLNSSLPYPYNVNFFSHLYVLLGRLRSYRYTSDKNLEYAGLRKDIRNNPEVFSVCQKIIRNVANYLGQDQAKFQSEEIYLFEYLVSSRFNEIDQLRLSDTDEAKSIAKDYIALVSEETNTRFSVALAAEIEKHVMSMVSRLNMDISLPNALLDEIRSEYSDLLAAVAKASKTISEKYHLPTISDDESGFIALYFAKSLESAKSQVNAYIVCTTGIGTSELVATKVRNLWPEVNIVGVGPNLNAQKIAKSESIDMLISTVPLPEITTVPVQVVSAFLTEKDKENVSQTIQKIKTGN